MSVPLGPEPTSIHHRGLPPHFSQLRLGGFFFFCFISPLLASWKKDKTSSRLSSCDSIAHAVTKKTSAFLEYTIASFSFYFDAQLLPSPRSRIQMSFSLRTQHGSAASPGVPTRSLRISLDVSTPSEVCALGMTRPLHQSELVLYSLLQSVTRDCEAQYGKKRRQTCCRSCGRCTATTVARRQIQPCYGFFGSKSAIAQTQEHTQPETNVLVR